MFELKQYPNQQARLLQIRDVQILIIENEGQFVTQDLLKADGVLIQAATHYEAESILHMIRSHKTKEISLMPAFIDAGLAYQKKVAFLFDGIFDVGKEEFVIDCIRKIKEQLRRIEYSVHELDFDRFSKLRFLQFMYSRQSRLKPTLSRSAQLGYTYPFVSSFNTKQSDIYQYSLLNQLSEEGYVKSQVHDKVHSCSSCNSGMLNYRECCPKCGSADLTTSDLIHHFVCANIGPEEDYKQGDDLVCPKCDKKLRHIGIDYDKPSSMNRCNTCNHEFQSAKVKAICMDCGCDNELSQLGDHTIYNYEITEKGEYTALYGFGEASKKSESQASSSLVVSSEIFELFKKQELHRVKVDQSSSFEISISITSQVLPNLHEDRKEILRHEITRIMAHYLHGTDLVCSNNVLSYRALICSTNQDRMENLMELFYNNVKRLLEDGISETSLEIDVRAENLLEGA